MSKTVDKPSILIVEDDPQNLKFLRLLLSKNFDVDLSDNEADFFKKISGNTYEAILMDISISGEKSGLALIKSLRKIPFYMNVPVICLSAHVSEADKQEAMKAGADIYLRKPVQNKVLIETIIEQINSYRLNL